MSRQVRAGGGGLINLDLYKTKTWLIVIAKHYTYENMHAYQPQSAGRQVDGSI